MNILVSACLLGMDCRYDGTHAYCPALEQLMAEHVLIPVCPERRGGLDTPRVPAERQGERVVTRDGDDVTSAYIAGAQEALRLAKQYDCRYAIFKERSPSCGSGAIYDGSFSARLIPGDGVAAQLLRKNGVIVLGESQISALVSR